MAGCFLGGSDGGGRAVAAQPPPADTLLETNENTVTEGWEETRRWIEVSKCRCHCWFCDECCRIKGRALQAELIPILESFRALLLVTLTVDPKLFGSPREAYLYMLDRRCVSRTVQDLRRGGHLHSSRYFYVLEWQPGTQQVHFHVLLDSSFVPFDDLLASWSKHRPRNGGPIRGKRPGFGTVFLSRDKFEGGATHAARYATKYLTKVSATGFPEWVLAMGKERRIRRYSTSRGFWNRPSVERSTRVGKSDREWRTYADRIKECGDTVNAFRVSEGFSVDTGELTTVRKWIAELDVPWQDVKRVPVMFEREGCPVFPTESLREARAIMDKALGRPVRSVRGMGLRER